MAQDPAAGSAVSPGGLVTLYVSKGPESAKPSASASAKPTAAAEPTKNRRPLQPRSRRRPKKPHRSLKRPQVPRNALHGRRKYGRR